MEEFFRNRGEWRSVLLPPISLPLCLFFPFSTYALHMPITFPLLNIHMQAVLLLEVDLFHIYLKIYIYISFIFSCLLLPSPLLELTIYNCIYSTQYFCWYFYVSSIILKTFIYLSLILNIIFHHGVLYRWSYQLLQWKGEKIVLVNFLLWYLHTDHSLLYLTWDLTFKSTSYLFVLHISEISYVINLEEKNYFYTQVILCGLLQTHQNHENRWLLFKKLC